MSGTLEIRKQALSVEKTAPVKKLLFSVGADDCRWEFSRSSGNGGQNVNKVNSKVRCIHRDSGAIGVAQDTRHQHQNKKIAFRRMAESKEFKAWHKIEVAKRIGAEIDIEEVVDNLMQNKNIRIEIKVDGLWREVDHSYFDNSAVQLIDSFV